MSQYKVGTVTVTNSDTEVVGASTDFTGGNANVGDLFKIRGEAAWYTVNAINTATNITISPAYAGSTGGGKDYAVVKDFTPNKSYPEISSGDIDWPDIYTRALRAVDSESMTVAQPSGSVTVQASWDMVLPTGTVTVTLPAASNKQRIYIGNRGTGTITISRAGSDNIASSGALLTSITRSTQYDVVVLIGDGVDKWYKMG